MVVAFLYGGFAATWNMAANANDAILALYATAFGQAWALDWGRGCRRRSPRSGREGFGLLLLVAWAPRQVRTAFDGFILAAFIGLGFQIIEDIAYALTSAGSQFGANQVGASLGTIVLRMVSGADRPAALRHDRETVHAGQAQQPFAQPAAERRRDIQNPSVSWSPRASSSTGAGTNADRPRQSRQQPSYPRISIPHLGFRYDYWSAGGSLKAGVRVCAGGWPQACRASEGVAIRPSPNRCDRARCRNPRSTRLLQRPVPIHSPDGR